MPFAGSRSGEFTVGAEVIPMEYLAMLMGGTLDEEGNIVVTDEIPFAGYVATGTFKGKKHGDNSIQIFNIILYNVTPQPNIDLTLNATDVGSFQLVFDVLSDENGNIAKVSPVTGS